MKYYNFFVRYVGYPLWMIKDGNQEIFKFLYKYRNYDKLSREELLDRQEKSLKKILRHAEKNSMFYAELFKRNGVDTNSNQSPFKLILRLPILTKDIINKNRKYIIASNFKTKMLYQDSTGGSTGTPLIFYRDKKCILKRRAQEIFFDNIMGCRIGDKIGLFVAARHHPNGLKGIKSKIRNSTSSRILAFDPNRSDNAYMENFAEKLINYKPDFIKCFPNSLYIFACYLKEKGITDIRPKAISCTGETLHKYQKLLFEEVFFCPVYEKYGSFEIGVAACECTKQNGMHIFTDGAYFEFINKNGEKANPGEMAKLVVTDLFNYGFPLIRYQIGDIGAYSNDICSCGSQLPIMTKLYGRDRDILVDSNGNLKAGYLFVEVFNKNKLPGKFQVIQESQNLVIVKVVKKEEYNESHEKLIIKKFEELLGNKIQIKMDYVKDIPREPSGKYKWVHSKLSAI